MHSLYWEEFEKIFTENYIQVDLFNSRTVKAYGFHKPVLINIEIPCEKFK